MRILLVGVLNDPESTNWHQARVLWQLGHKVHAFNYRLEAEKAAAQGDIEKAGDWFKEQVNKFGPDFILFSKFNNWPTTAITWAREQGTHCHFWYMDPMLQLTSGLVNHALACDTASCTGAGQTEYLKALGANAFHIQEGVDAYETYYPVEVDEKIADIVFVGATTAERYNLANVIKQKDVTILPVGPGWGTIEQIDAEKFRELCAGCTLVLGCDRESYTQGYFSDRAFRVMACRGVYITLKSPGMDEWLTHEKNVLMYDTEEELIEAIVDITNNPENYPLDEIRKNARALILEKHTWKHAMQRLIDVVEDYDG